MADSQGSIEAVAPASPSSSSATWHGRILAKQAKILVLPFHLDTEKLHTIKTELSAAGASPVDDIFGASLVLTEIANPRRARYELQIRHVDVHLLRSVARDVLSSPGWTSSNEPPVKRLKQAHSPPRSESALSRGGPLTPVLASTRSPVASSNDLQVRIELREPWIRVLRLAWLHNSISCGQALPYEPYIILEGPLREATGGQTPETPDKAGTAEHQKPDIGESSSPVVTTKGFRASSPTPAQDLAARAASSEPETGLKHIRVGTASPGAYFGDSGPDTEASPSTPVDMPDWATKGKLYACERSTPPNSPNAGFIEQLKKIRLVRTLVEDEIGVRAYSTSIAGLAAFPRPLSNSREVLALPGCDRKIARLFREYQATGRLQAAEQIVRDPALSVIAEFYDIWGVGARTAREFYYDRGWRSLDDIVEYGWNVLTRSQQVGLKYQEEFSEKISRSEVEFIASVVKYHASRLVDDGIECIIVGGYRRGKAESGDVDLILSHRKEEATVRLVLPLVHALEKSGWVTHLLTLSEKNSGRDQQPLPIRSNHARRGGFDTLDKALVVWRDPTRSTKSEDEVEDAGAATSNPHRRVDIIITPWRTVGCAVAGWSSGTTFQRDLRRYAKHAKGWKFDSSGVRDRMTGQWIDLEGWMDEKTRAATWEEAERRVFHGLGLKWREPWERCTE